MYNFIYINHEIPEVADVENVYLHGICEGDCEKDCFQIMWIHEYFLIYFFMKSIKVSMDAAKVFVVIVSSMCAQADS